MIEQTFTEMAARYGTPAARKLYYWARALFVGFAVRVWGAWSLVFTAVARGHYELTTTRTGESNPMDVDRRLRRCLDHHFDPYLTRARTILPRSAPAYRSRRPSALSARSTSI